LSPHLRETVIRKLFWALLTVSLLLVSLYSAADTISPPLVPDPQLTPGDVLTTDVAAICTPGYAKSVRNVPVSIKNQVYRAYSILSHKPREYEIDHLMGL
jgi:hypothetical protein